MLSSRRSQSSPDPGQMAAGGDDEQTIDEAMRKRYANDRGLGEFATWDEITAFDSERRRARADSLAAASAMPDLLSPTLSESATPISRSSLSRTDSSESGIASAVSIRNCELEMQVGKLHDELRDQMEKCELLSSTFAREKASLQDARLVEARERLRQVSLVAEQLSSVQRAVALLVNAVPFDQQEGLRGPRGDLEGGLGGLGSSLQTMVAAEQQLVTEAEAEAKAMAVHAARTPVPATELRDAARRAGLSDEQLVARQRELVSVSGVSITRASELLGMADFDVNRAAEFHFTHPEPEPELLQPPPQLPFNLLGGDFDLLLPAAGAAATDTPAASTASFAGDNDLLSLTALSSANGTPRPLPVMSISLPLSPESLKLLIYLQATARGGLARRSHQKRSQIAQELLLTERSFYQGLQVIIEVYYRPLIKLSNAGHDAAVFCLKNDEF